MKQSKLLIQIIAGSSESDSSEFKEYIQFIGTLFSYNIPPLNVGKTKKILVELFQENGVLYVIPEKENESLYTVRRSFDFIKFNSLEDRDKKVLLSETVRDALLFLFDKFAWDYNIVETTYDKIIERDFQSQFMLEEFKYNKAGNIKATIVVEHFLKEALISIVFLNKSDHVLKKIDLFKTAPSHLFYGQLLGTTKWLSNDEFQISNKTKEYSIKASLDGGTSVTYSPKQRDVEGVKEEIRFFTTQQLIQI